MRVAAPDRGTIRRMALDAEDDLVLAGLGKRQSPASAIYTIDLYDLALRKARELKERTKRGKKPGTVSLRELAEETGLTRKAATKLYKHGWKDTRGKPLAWAPALHDVLAAEERLTEETRRNLAEDEALETVAVARARRELERDSQLAVDSELRRDIKLYRLAGPAVRSALVTSIRCGRAAAELAAALETEIRRLRVAGTLDAKKAPKMLRDLSEVTRNASAAARELLSVRQDLVDRVAAQPREPEDMTDEEIREELDRALEIVARGKGEGALEQAQEGYEPDEAEPPADDPDDELH